jgi:hypothetical protein
MGSDLYRIVLLGGLLPGLIVGVGLLLLFGLLRGEGRDGLREHGRRLRWGAPLLFFLGYLAVQGATGKIGPELWSSSVGDRFLGLGALGLACALLDAVSPWRLLGRLGTAIGGALATWMIVVVLHPHLLGTGDVVWWSVLGGVGCGWTFLAIVLAGYLALARTLGDITPPDLAVALVLAGVVTGALGRWVGARARNAILGGLIALVFAAAPIGAGAFLAWRAYDSVGADSDGDGDDDVYYYTDDDE